MHIKTLMVASFLICAGSIAHADPYLLYANGTASGLEDRGSSRVTGNFTGTLYVDPGTFNVTSEDITFTFSSGTVYRFQSSAIPSVSTLPVPGFGPYTNYSFVQNGTTTVQVVEDLVSPPNGSLEALNFSFADNSAALFGAGEPINKAAIGGQYTEQGPYQAIGYLTTTPKPSSFILLGTGTLGLAGVVRRRFFNT